MAIFYFFIFLFGLAVWSFLNCVIYRLEKGESFLKGRSYCPHCRHQLSWQDLIPVFSFLLLRGKCRYCQKPISRQYPLVEIITGALFSFSFFIMFQPLATLFNYPMELLGSIYYLFIISFLMIIFVYDLKHYIIPDKVVFPAIAIVFLFQVFRILNFGNLNLFGIWDLGFGILPSLFLLAIILFSGGKWMGLGDFKLAILMGLFLGFPDILVALFSAFFLGAAIGIGLILAGKKKMKSQVPFGPFLVAGTFIALFWGSRIIEWYLNLLTI